MTIGESNILLGDTPIGQTENVPTGEFVQMMGEQYYRIGHVDQMPPFFISLVSGTDHWLFIASNGGLTAGRINADSALFSYETEDRLIAYSDHVGSRTILRVTRQGNTYLWEPFSSRYEGVYDTEQNLYKNVYGNKLIFEETNRDLNLVWRTVWRTSDRFGFVKTSQLQNEGESVAVSLIDGLQNILPFGVTSAVQSVQSNLLHAYKRSELEPETGMGIFSMSATLTDRAEPSESLMATVAWQVGLDGVTHLLSTNQLKAFSQGRDVVQELDIRGQAGSYFTQADFVLTEGETREWHIAADVNQDSGDLVRLSSLLEQDDADLIDLIERDIDATTDILVKYVASADGLQQTGDENTVVHHFANVMFNIMRGGIFIDGYQVEKEDFLEFIQTRNRPLLKRLSNWFADLPDQFAIQELYDRAAAADSPDLARLSFEYLPLTFSRRHGDPSRPWNRFSINLKKPDGSPRLDYQGNWRDIFQNWEPLLLAFPAFVPGIIAKFLNATTAEGYNPYRVTRAGIEWEVPEPDNPWANIGYWSDHQIIYLQKLLEIAEDVKPGMLTDLWRRPIFATANVPYRIRPYEQILDDWYSTIDFDHELDSRIEAAVEQVGTDARLIRDDGGNVIHVTMMEKLLILLLAKLSNLVPDGGIWMNTQRPEWNDANNALVGKGISIVTAAYLLRFIAFWRNELAGLENQSFSVQASVARLFGDVAKTLEGYAAYLERGFDDRTRRAMMDDLGEAATRYRSGIYESGIASGEAAVTGEAVANLLSLAQAYLEHTLRANKRADGLYHSYNILKLSAEKAAIGHLYPMLEGQVAMLSSGLLDPNESLDLLQALPKSDLFRADQHSYMLYPNRSLPGFLEKNRVPEERVASSALVQALTAAGDVRLIYRDPEGTYHFNGHFRNVGDAADVLDELSQEPEFSDLVRAEHQFILNLFEKTFDHQSFTGRSGTFFAYEGLGSIYWHMVSKLLLAAQESLISAQSQGADARVVEALEDAYYDIRQGLGFNKTPAEYGAFPTDPYSHTPWDRGARQPGMTGLVKEEILTRFGELGVDIANGSITFAPSFLRQEEFFSMAHVFHFVDVSGRWQSLSLPPESLAFTLCQTPIIYTIGKERFLAVAYRDGQTQTASGNRLDEKTSRHIFQRDGVIKNVHVTVTGPFE